MNADFANFKPAHVETLSRTKIGLQAAAGKHSDKFDVPAAKSRLNLVSEFWLFLPVALLWAVFQFFVVQEHLPVHDFGLSFVEQERLPVHERSFSYEMQVRLPDFVFMVAGPFGRTKRSAVRGTVRSRRCEDRTPWGWAARSVARPSPTASGGGVCGVPNTRTPRRKLRASVWRGMGEVRRPTWRHALSHATSRESHWGRCVF